MDFNSHSALEGQHAFLSASSYHWINYDDQKLRARYISAQAAKRGTDLHEFAHKAIVLKQRLPKTRKTINMYVNDGISYGMSVEQPLYYSDNAFGTADTISFDGNRLRISDLKTGITVTSQHQLEVYAAYFCLEYSQDPYQLVIELRIYQNDDVRFYEGNSDLISRIMDKTVDFDMKIEAMKRENL